MVCPGVACWTQQIGGEASDALVRSIQQRWKRMNPGISSDLAKLAG